MIVSHAGGSAVISLTQSFLNSFYAENQIFLGHCTVCTAISLLIKHEDVVEKHYKYEAELSINCMAATSAISNLVTQRHGFESLHSGKMGIMAHFFNSGSVISMSIIFRLVHNFFVIIQNGEKGIRSV